MPKIFTLSAKERLKSRKRIAALFESGKKFNAGPFRVFYLQNNPGKQALRFGVGVSVRNFKKAVDRNRIKRLTRECWRLQKINLVYKPGELDVFIIYTGKIIPAYKAVSEWMEQVVAKLLSLS